MSFCIGGQAVSPYEQKTQQSPSLGRIIVSQLGHFQKNWHASVGIVSRDWELQFGHVMVDCNSTLVIRLPRCSSLWMGTQRSVLHA